MQVQTRRLRILAGDVQLEAMLHLPGLDQPAALLVVCHPNPLYGGSMDNNVVAALCEAALQEGMAALRFNFRGVGASGGVHGGGEPEAADLLAVMDFAATQPGGETLSLAGYSFGARVAALASNRAVSQPRCLVLVSPPLSALVGGLERSSLEAGLSGDGKQLWITGDRDSVCPAAELEAQARRRGSETTCTVIDGPDHSWLGYEAELRDIVGGFLRWHAASSH